MSAGLSLPLPQAIPVPVQAAPHSASPTSLVHCGLDKKFPPTKIQCMFGPHVVCAIWRGLENFKGVGLVGGSKSPGQFPWWCTLSRAPSPLPVFHELSSLCLTASPE